MAINNPIVTDSEWLQATAVAIQNKDGGGKMEVPDFASRIDALPAAPVLIPKTITENGTYAAEDDNADGYSGVTVDVRQISGDYIIPIEITIGANAISNVAQLISFFNSAVSERGMDYLFCFSISENKTFVQNLVLCNYYSSGRLDQGSVYRFRNGQVAQAPIGEAFDAYVPEGTRYVIYAGKTMITTGN